jgi:hypothetical protein
MEPSPSLEVAQLLKYPNILWSPNDHCNVNKSPPLLSIFSRWIQLLPPHRIDLITILILSSHLSLSLPSGLFSFWLSHQNYISLSIPLLSHACCIPCSSYPPWLYYSNYIWREIQVNEAHHCVIFPSILSFRPCLVQTFSSAPWICVRPSMSETKFHTHDFCRFLLKSLSSNTVVIHCYVHL